MIRGLVNGLPLVKFTPILVLSLYMTVKCPVRARWRINCTISGLIVTTERGNSQFEYCYRVVILWIDFLYKITSMFQSEKAVYHKLFCKGGLLIWLHEEK